MNQPSRLAPTAPRARRIAVGLASATLITLALTTSPVRADPADDVDPAPPPATNPATRPAKEEERDADRRLIVRLTLPPAAVPEPHLKVRLLPPPTDEVPGDGVANLYGAYDWIVDRYERVEPEQFYDTPLADLPAALVAADVAAATKAGADDPTDPAWQSYPADDRAAAFLDLAVRHERFDWNPPYREMGDGVMLPYLNGIAGLSWWSAGRVRVELGRHGVDAAIHALQTGLALPRTLTYRPLLVQALVQFQFAYAMLDRLPEVMATPGAPNFYWALADLPRPFVELRAAARMESLLLDVSLPSLAPIARDPGGATAGQVESLRAEFARVFDAEPVRREGKPAWDDALVAWSAGRARSYLTGEAGVAPGRVAAMTDAQAVGVFFALQFRSAYDAALGYFSLPYAAAAGPADRLDRELRGLRRGGGEDDAGDDAATVADVNPLAAALLPSLRRAQFEQARLDRRIALLMAVEAVRAHAAAHGGLPPATLGEVVDTPVLPDPVTGGPFGYDLDGRTFTLTADVPGEPQHSVKYVVTLAAE